MRKLDDRSRPRVFIGYADGTKAYRVYDLKSRCVLMSRDVVFDETGVGLEQQRGARCVNGGGAQHRLRARCRWRVRRSGHSFADCSRPLCVANSGHLPCFTSLTSSGGAWERCIDGWRVDSAFLYIDAARLALLCFGANLCFGTCLSDDSGSGRDSSFRIGHSPGGR